MPNQQPKNGDPQNRFARFRTRITSLKIGQRFRYFWYSRSFSVFGKKLQLTTYLTQKSFGILSSIYFIGLVSASFVVAGMVTDFDNIDLGSITITAGGMLGGMLAIVFSVQTILMQNAAERASSGFFKTLANDNRQKIIFWLVALSVLSLFLIGYADGFYEDNLLGRLFRIQVPFILIGLTLWLLFQSYRLALKQIDPSTMIEKPAKDALSLLRQMEKIATKLALVIENDPKNQEKPSKHLAEAAAFQVISPLVAELEGQFDFFFDFHDKLVISQNKSAARKVITVIQNIILRYFTLRKNSSMIRPTDILMASTSDSQLLLTKVFEGLVAKGSAYLQAEDDVGITHVIRILKNLTLYSSVIRFQRERDENPIFTQAKFYLDSLAQRAMDRHSMEAVFQAALVYSEIGKVAVQKGYAGEIESTFKMLQKVVVEGLHQKQNVIWGRALDGYLVILQEMVKTNYYNFEIQLRSLLESLQGSIFFIWGLTSVGIVTDDFYNATNLTKPFEMITRLIHDVDYQSDKAKNDEDRKMWQGIFLHLAEEYLSMLRYLSEKMKSADAFIMNAISDSIASIGTAMLENTKNPNWADEKDELMKQSNWYVHQPGWFFYHADKINTDRSFDSLVEAVTKIGLVAVETDNDDTATQAIKALAGFSTKILKKAGDREYGFTEPRIMERACFIGILAKKKHKKEIVDFLKTKIIEFEVSYKLAWFSHPGTKPTSPSEDQLQSEIAELKYDLEHASYNRYLDILEDSKSDLFKKVTPDDIDQFTMEVWGVTQEITKREVVF